MGASENAAQGVALVTGGRRGIGYSVAEHLVDENYHVVINDLVSRDAVTEQLRTLGSDENRVSYVQADVSEPRDREMLLQHIEDEHGTLHVLVNNAGIAPDERTDILHASEESFDRLMEVNLKGPYFLTQAAAQLMIRTKKDDKQRSYCIVNISSSNAVAAAVRRGEYCLSKAGVHMASRLWAVRLAEFDIPVYEIQPGIIETDMTGSVHEKYDDFITSGRVPQHRWGQPEDVGRAVAMLARGDLAFSTGQVLHIDGGLLIPRF